MQKSGLTLIISQFRSLILILLCIEDTKSCNNTVEGTLH